MPIDTIQYEQYLPTSQRFDSKLPDAIDELDDLWDRNVAQDGQPFSLDFEVNEGFDRTYRTGRLLARRSVELGRLKTDSRELHAAYYTGLMLSRQAIRLVQNTPVYRVDLRSVTGSKGGVTGAIEEYESTRPNLSEYARSRAELIEEDPSTVLAVGDAAILGFLLYERADGKNRMTFDIDACLDDSD